MKSFKNELLKLAKTEGYPAQKLSASTYLKILTKAHNKVYNDQSILK